MSAFAVPLTNIFAMLGAGPPAQNGFGLNTGVQVDTAAPSPFSSLLVTPSGNGFGLASPEDESPKKRTADNTGTLPADSFIKTAQANLKTKAVEKSKEDLASAELLMSDLLAVNWDALQPGDTIALPNGWTLTAGDGGMFSLANEAQGLVVPPFSKEQLDMLAQRLSNGAKNPDMLTAPKGEDGDEKAENSAAQNNNNKPHKKEAAADTTASASSNANTNATPLGAPVSDSNVTNSAAVAANVVAASSGAATATQNGGGRVAVNGVAVTNGRAIVFSPTTRIDHFFGGDNNSLFTPLPDSAFLGENTDNAAFGQHQAFYQQLGLRTNGNGTLTGTQPMSSAQLQVVIQKMAERGDNRTLTVQMDPAELGKVQVELSSGRDKILKAHILVEKPEALALLQKDISQLEKALNDAGITLDGDQISLDLADQNGGQGGSFAQQAFAEMAEELRNNMAVVSIDDILKIDVDLPVSVSSLAADNAVNIMV